MPKEKKFIIAYVRQSDVQKAVEGKLTPLRYLVVTAQDEDAALKAAERRHREVLYANPYTAKLVKDFEKYEGLKYRDLQIFLASRKFALEAAAKAEASEPVDGGVDQDPALQQTAETAELPETSENTEKPAEEPLSGSEEVAQISDAWVETKDEDEGRQVSAEAEPTEQAPVAGEEDQEDTSTIELIEPEPDQEKVKEALALIDAAITKRRERAARLRKEADALVETSAHLRQEGSELYNELEHTENLLTTRPHALAALLADNGGKVLEVLLGLDTGLESEIEDLGEDLEGTGKELEENTDRLKAALRAIANVTFELEALDNLRQEYEVLLDEELDEDEEDGDESAPYGDGEELTPATKSDWFGILLIITGAVVVTLGLVSLIAMHLHLSSKSAWLHVVVGTIAIVIGLCKVGDSNND